MSVLPAPLHCITIASLLDDVDAIEHYLTIEPEITEKYLPLAIRDVLSPLAEKYELPPMPIPSADNTLHILQILWSYSPEQIYTSLFTAISHKLPYLVPYLFVRNSEVKYAWPP